MKIPVEVMSMIASEQARQVGNFIPEGDAYLNKIEREAELLVHFLPTGCSGFVFFYCNDPECKYSYITLLMTAPNARKLGVGTALVSNVLNITKQRGFKYCELEVRKENRPAAALYESLGFAIVADRGEKFLMRAKII